MSRCYFDDPWSIISSIALTIAQKYDDEERPSVAACHLMMMTRNNDDILMLARCYDEMLPLWWWRVCACHWQFGAARASWWSAECSRKCRRPGSTASARPTTSTSTTLPRTADHQACCHRRSTFCTPCLRFLLLGARPLRSNWGLGPHNLRGPAINMHCNFKYPF